MRTLISFCFLLAACSPDEYVCRRAQECVAPEGGFGMCLEDHCAFYDATCPLSFPWRHDEASGPLAGECAAEPAEAAAH